MRTCKEIAYRLSHRLNGVGFQHWYALARIEKTLHRWAEHECNGTIQRDEKTGRPFGHNPNHSFLDPHDPRASWRVADREAGALRRLALICKPLGLHYYHQTDPRGCALYVSTIPLDDANYSSYGVAVC